MYANALAKQAILNVATTKYDLRQRGYRNEKISACSSEHRSIVKKKKKYNNVLKPRFIFISKPFKYSENTV